jgi:hypothetical protein
MSERPATGDARLAALLRAERLLRRNQERLESTKKRIYESVFLVLIPSATGDAPSQNSRSKQNQSVRRGNGAG